MSRNLKIALALAYAAVMAVILGETNFLIDIHPPGLIGFVTVFTAIVALCPIAG